MIPYDLPASFILSVLFLMGAVIGSFLTVCIHRFPRHPGILAGWRSLVHNPSHCDRCDQRLLTRDNVPIFGWLWLLGRCRFCRQPIPAIYPLIEAANGLLFVLIYAWEVPLNHWTPLASCSLTTAWSPAGFENVWLLSDSMLVNCRFLYHLVLAECLLVAAFIDWELGEIPDALTLPALLVGVFGSALLGPVWLVPLWTVNPEETIWADWLPDVSGEGWLAATLQPHWYSLLVSLAGLTVASLTLWGAQRSSQWALRKNTLGDGDILLAAVVGSFLGWQPAVVAIVLAMSLSLLSHLVFSPLGSLGREQPFAPSLAFAVFMILVGWQWIWRLTEWHFTQGPLLLLIAGAVGAMALPVLWYWREHQAPSSGESSAQHQPHVTVST